MTGIKNILKDANENETEKEYLKALLEIITWGSITDFDIKRILREIGKENSNTERVAAIKGIIPDDYLNTILKKEENISSEPETILLAEELL